MVGMNQKQSVLKNALRYAGVQTQPDPALASRLDALYEKALASSRFRITFLEDCVDSKEPDLPADKPGIRLQRTGLFLPGSLAKRMLSGSQSVTLLGCTLGQGFDAALSRMQMLNMADALLFDAIGSALIEDCLDQWQSEYVKKKRPLFPSDRFSAGYGDLPLGVQKEMAQVLKLPANIGVYLSDSLMMNPTKSVTALLGFFEDEQPARIRGCQYCSFQKRCLHCRPESGEQSVSVQN